MEEIHKEIQLKWSKKQLQSLINYEFKKENGLNDLFSMLVNEHNLFLEIKEDTNNKGNGYRIAT